MTARATVALLESASKAMVAYAKSIVDRAKTGEVFDIVIPTVEGHYPKEYAGDQEVRRQLIQNRIEHYRTTVPLGKEGAVGFARQVLSGGPVLFPALKGNKQIYATTVHVNQKHPKLRFRMQNQIATEEYYDYVEKSEPKKWSIKPHELLKDAKKLVACVLQASPYIQKNILRWAMSQDGGVVYLPILARELKSAMSKARSVAEAMTLPRPKPRDVVTRAKAGEKFDVTVPGWWNRHEIGGNQYLRFLLRQANIPHHRTSVGSRHSGYETTIHVNTPSPNRDYRAALWRLQQGTFMGTARDLLATMPKVTQSRLNTALDKAVHGPIMALFQHIWDPGEHGHGPPDGNLAIVQELIQLGARPSALSGWSFSGAVRFHPATARWLFRNFPTKLPLALGELKPEQIAKLGFSRQELLQLAHHTLSTQSNEVL